MCVCLSSNLHNFRVRAQTHQEDLSKDIFLSFCRWTDRYRIVVGSWLLFPAWPLPFVLTLKLIFISISNIVANGIFPPDQLKKTISWSISFFRLQLPAYSLLLFCSIDDRDTVFIRVLICHLSRPFVVIYRLPIIAKIPHLCFHFSFRRIRITNDDCRPCYCNCCCCLPNKKQTCGSCLFCAATVCRLIRTCLKLRRSDRMVHISALLAPSLFKRK